LNKEQAMQFHHTVAQTLFVSTCVRRDIQTVVAFLTTRVKRPDEDDWGKLKTKRGNLPEMFSLLQKVGAK
jgi:RNAse (barnase) inhibitor barstar